eukprot:14351837-Alexandrium_andersonii.AAC.1
MPSGMHFRRYAEAGPGCARVDPMPSRWRFSALRRGGPGVAPRRARCPESDISGVARRQAWECRGRDGGQERAPVRRAAHRGGA